ncbi:phage holin family protein [Halomonas sp. EGI 63088]|uniref:Phage holin family protein n=1 Tax=Halomonas flagellata TaxID=2920385 RepID=A0ABS9RZA5_9GAMM|nr:phage holin family protein [Halomonas flagellata]MCH4565164.1 phage holin family protein [Halomonas flagellata]
MAESQGPAQRLFTAGKRLLGSLLATGETRLRLAVLELEEERARLVTLLLLAGLSLLLLLLGLAVLTLLVVVMFWDSHRLVAIGLSALILLGSGVALALWVRRLARRRTLLASTLKHLATDRELVERSRHD